MGLIDRAPRGLVRWLFRAPILLYRLGLGPLFGRRLVYLAHRGRRSGLRRETVVEVVRLDRDRREVYVVSGWGGRSDWYRNLRAAPAIEVRLGARRYPAPAHRFLAPDETVRLLAGYRAAHPRAWRRLAPVMGVPLDPELADPGTLPVRAVSFRLETE